MAASKSTFETIREMVASGNIDQSSVDLLLLGGMADIKDELNEIRNYMKTNFVKKETEDERKMREAKERKQDETNQKVAQMWNWHSVLKWLVIVGVPMIIGLLLSIGWGLMTNKIAITVIP